MIVIFIFVTDLDGTLLGHDNFDFEPIKAGLKSLLEAGHKLVLASSKTKAEIEDFCNNFGCRLPFVYENGAGFENIGFLSDLRTSSYSNRNSNAIRIKNLLAVWEKRIPLSLRRYCTFVKDMDQKAQETCLGLRGAALDRALNRFYSLPLIFSGTKLQLFELQQEVVKAGLSLQEGGRVSNLSGCHDKADYLSEIRNLTTQTKDVSVVIGLGDSKNDIEMLKQADVSCVIPNRDGTHLNLGEGIVPTIVAPRAAPLGWLDAALGSLALFSAKKGINYG